MEVQLSPALFLQNNTNIEINESELVRKYYSEQNDLLQLLSKRQQNNGKENQRQPVNSSKDDKLISFAIYVSFFSNIALLIIKIYALLLSNSLSMLSSLFDSSLDIISGLILFVATKMSKERDKYKV